MALDDFMHPPQQVVVVAGSDRNSATITRWLRRAFLPGGLSMIVSESEASSLSRRWMLFKGKTAHGGATTAYVCRNGTCGPPLTSVDALSDQLGG